MVQHVRLYHGDVYRGLFCNEQFPKVIRMVGVGSDFATRVG